MSEKPTTTRAGRFFKLAGMTASVAGQFAAQKARRTLDRRNADSIRADSYTRMANQIADTLGHMKGAVMKVGQVASQTQDFLPPEFSRALERLQKDAPPMPYETIRRQVETQLGQKLPTLFAWFQEVPYASASIGQVHRARLHDGTEVIVKVQYPGVDESCDSDLRQLRMTLKLGGLLKMPEATVDELFREIRVRLKEELDYENEASNLRLFRKLHDVHPWVVIPRPVDTHSNHRILTLELVGGDHISQVTPERYSQETRNLIGQRLFTTMADQLFRFGRIHGDPHPGNFAFRPDGTLVIYDFGCVKTLKPEIVAAYRNAIASAMAEDYQTLDRHLIELGARIEGQPAVDEAYYAMWRDMLITPFRDDKPYDFGTADIHQQVAAQTKTVFEYLDHFQPPVETIFIDRMIAGHYWILKRLGVQAAFRSELEQYLKTGDSTPE